MCKNGCATNLAVYDACERKMEILELQVMVQCPMKRRIGITNQAIDPKDYSPLPRGRQVVSSNGRVPIKDVRRDEAICAV